MSMTVADLGLSEETLGQFCRRWKISRLAVFGSAAQGTMRADSDVDLLVTFDAGAEWSMFDHYAMEEELSRLFGREVDLVSTRAVQENPNPICRNQILDSARLIYAAM
jgi:predicted nucleotidyltransferase